MEETAFLNSIEKHLDSLESSFNWSLLLVLAAIWYGLQKPESNQIFELGSLKVPVRYVSLILGLILTFFHFYITLSFFRLLNLIDLLPIPMPSKANSGNAEEEEQFEKKFSINEKAFSRLLLHKWPMNPYSFFVESTSSMIYNSIGYPVIILSWFAGFTAIYITSQKISLTSLVILILYILAVALQLYSIGKVYLRIMGFISILNHIINSAFSLRWFHGLGELIPSKSLRQLFAIRVVLTFFSFLAGFLLFFISKAYKGTF
jgi:hypothetical protein